MAALGRILILGSLLAAAAGAVLGFVSARTRSADGLRWARRMAYVYAALIIGATLLMEYALLTHDFSVAYVAQVGSRAVPTWVSIVSLWSSLEGSLLFWGLVLGVYIALAVFFTRGQYLEYQPAAIGVWLSCAAFFSFLLAGPANPFGTVLNPPLDGPGPNPLLQNHVLMAVHPPFLYLGYVGMTIPFGFACAALIRGKLGRDILKPIRESLLLPWIFQSLAIMLGGWWAYEVLGWGGYWAWDPVENASLLPWLTATAAIHSLMVIERRGILKGWTVTLIQATFLLVILGTFMTRSGVFNSVHSFTQSAIGPTLLVFLAIALLFSVALLAFRIDTLESEGRIEGVATREAAFLFNNLLFVLLTFTVLIGTVFPLITEAVSGKQMSVGRPYFDSMVVPVGAALLFILGIGPALPWGRATAVQIRRALLPPFIGAAVLVVIGFFGGARSPWTLVTLAFGGYAAWVTVAQISRGKVFTARRRLASYVVHAAVIVMLIAVAVSSSMRETTELHFTTGQTQQASGHDVKFLGVFQQQEPHRSSLIGRFSVSRDGKELAVLEPRMNQYERMREPIGTPDVYTTAGGDFYIALSNIDPATQTASITVFSSPLIVWIWIAVVIMALGALFGLRAGKAAVTARAIVPAGSAPEPA
jgi:cytochrome c-type biogenesis protein CcmF